MGNHPNRSKVTNWPEYLRRFRQQYHMTQKQLADKLMISARTVENWEGGGGDNEPRREPAPYLKLALKWVAAQIITDEVKE